MSFAKFFKRFKKEIGPGIITGAADDDPSGITVYSIAGAKFNFSLLWTALFTWPLMGAIQMMCARIGMVTGRGLSSALSQKFSRKFVLASSVILLCANTFNISADFLAMADAAEILSGIGSHIWIIYFSLIITAAIIYFKYIQIANCLKWLVLALFTYVMSAFYAKPDWLEILKNTITPSMPNNSEQWSLLLAILGTTISPYLFYWQSSLEVEEEMAKGRDTI